MLPDAQIDNLFFFIIQKHFMSLNKIAIRSQKYLFLKQAILYFSLFKILKLIILPLVQNYKFSKSFTAMFRATVQRSIAEFQNQDGKIYSYLKSILIHSRQVCSVLYPKPRLIHTISHSSFQRRQQLKTNIILFKVFHVTSQL